MNVQEFLKVGFGQGQEGLGCDQTSETWNELPQEPESKFLDSELFNRNQTDKVKQVAKEILVLARQLNWMTF